MIKKFRALFSVSKILTIVLIGLLFISISVPAIALSGCEYLKGCEKKFCEIERQLKISQKKGNKNKVEGLMRSLKNAKKYCTTKGLKEDLLKEISKVKKEIVEYKSDLMKAKEHGKTDKVRKYQEKIKEEKNKLKLLEEELSDLS